MDVHWCELEFFSVAVFVSVRFCIKVFSISVGLVSVGACVALFSFPDLVSQSCCVVRGSISISVVVGSDCIGTVRVPIFAFLLVYGSVYPRLR